ncbi:MAG: hypothetical protein EBT79_08095 [Actinobacteria bacterium]|nr:hypothetical protein [Actinomycetota bacterium]NBR67218.1 hypothetical protein [Actinomycetota bacterium]
MHGRKIVAALTAVAMLASTLVMADNNVIDQGSYYKNAQSGAKVDANGNAYTTDASRDRDNWRLVPLLNTQLAASGANMVDSTATPVATYDFSRMNLLLKGNFDSLSTVVRVAVQIRGHWGTLSDSSAAYPWYRWPTRATSNGTTDIDSLGHMFVGTYAQAQLTSANQPFASGGVWPGEFIVKFNVATQDSTAAGAGKYGAGPNTMLIPLSDASGCWFNAPYTSVRIRVLNGVRNRFKIRADLMGVSK